MCELKIQMILFLHQVMQHLMPPTHRPLLPLRPHTPTSALINPPTFHNQKSKESKMPANLFNQVSNSAFSARSKPLFPLWAQDLVLLRREEVEEGRWMTASFNLRLVFLCVQPF